MPLPSDVLLCAHAGYTATVLLAPRMGASVPTWDDASPEVRDHAILVAEDVLDGCSVEVVHERWCARMLLDGWSYAPGPRDDVAKTSPALCPFAALPDVYQREDRLFHASVLAMAAALCG